jgi:hypothetical protein
MENLILKDEWNDEIEFQENSEGVGIIVRGKDADDNPRVLVVSITEAQARQAYMFLAEAIGVVEAGYNERHGG